MIDVYLKQAFSTRRPRVLLRSLDRTKLKEMLQVGCFLLRLIGKLLRVGVLDGEAYTTPDRGTAPGVRALAVVG